MLAIRAGGAPRTSEVNEAALLSSFQRAEQRLKDVLGFVIDCKEQEAGSGLGGMPPAMHTAPPGAHSAV